MTSNDDRPASPPIDSADARRSLPMLGDSSAGAAGRPPGTGTTLAAEGARPMDRRHALKIMALTAAAPTLSGCASVDDSAVPVDVASPTSNPMAAGTASDPDLLAPTVAWERKLTADELESLASLCDVIIPADERSPSASDVGAHDFIDEWVSAPYEGCEEDLITVRGGLVWLDREASARFGSALRFRDLSAAQQHEICDDICFEDEAAEGYAAAARFFDKVRDLTSTAFWTTTEGMEDLQYVGNVPLPRWDPPPPEVLRHIGLA